MKAITAVCATGASVPAIINGRISRHRDGENAEIQMYLSKLKDLVPFMPKNRKLSKLEIIQHVIDYICDLQNELETHPAINNFDAAAALNGQSSHIYNHNSNNNNQVMNDNNSLTETRINYINNVDDYDQDENSNPLLLSSLSVRQPLTDRPSPNTILSSSAYSSSSTSSLSTTSNKETTMDTSHC